MDLAAGSLNYPDGSLAVIVQASHQSTDLSAWVHRNRAALDALLLEHGAVVFRGFNIDAAEGLENVIKSISGQTLEYREKTSPRHRVSGNIYTSTDYPAKHRIFLHNESSYNIRFPGKLFFLCLTAAQEGGATPLADTRKIYRRIDPRIRERFRETGYIYVRNFDGGVGLTWQDAFQTDDRRVVEEYCVRSRIEFEWMGGGRLRTSQVRRAIAKHPRTGDSVWFNHATFFHISTLPPLFRDSLLEMFDEPDLPNNTYYGDGQSIEPDVLDHLREAYEQEMTSLPWREGDLLVLDNMLTAHAREPFVGPRNVVVGMSEPCTWDEVEADAS